MATEKRLIYMDDTMDKLRCYAERKHDAGYIELANGILKAVNYINNDIGRVDAVEVVRCKDCKYMEMTPDGLRECHVWNGINGMGDEGFCNYGERRNDGR